MRQEGFFYDFGNGILLEPRDNCFPLPCNITKLLCEFPVPVLLNSIASALEVDQDEPGVDKKIPCCGKLEMIRVIPGAQESQLKEPGVSQPVDLTILRTIRFYLLEFGKLGFDKVFVEFAGSSVFLKGCVVFAKRR
jgi:hypothetical protein